MKKSMIAAMIGLAIGTGFTNAARAEEQRSWNWSPLGIGIAAPIQLPFMETDVHGLRIGGLFGCNQDVCGLDAGLCEVSSGSFAGVGAAAFNWVGKNAYGLQVGALANVVALDAYGLEAGLVNVVHGGFTGLQLGLVNYDANFAGGRFGLVNWSKTTSAGFDIGLVSVSGEDFAGLKLGALNLADRFVGAQIGLFNLSDGPSTGFQLGLVNAANYFTGLQLGIINLICKGPLPVMLIANASF